MIRLGVGVVIAIAAYSGGWYYMADRAKSWLETAMQKSKDNHVAIDCPDLDIRGYPFRIGAFCSGLKFDATDAGISASFGEIRSAAQIYNPGHAVVEIDGPADIRTSFGFMANATWSATRASVVGDFSSLQRLAAESDNVNASFGDPTSAFGVTADFKHGELHIRQNENDVDIATETMAGTFRTALLPVVLPVSDIISDVTLTGQADVLKGKKPFVLRGISGKLNKLAVDFGASGAVSVSGSFKIDENGYLSGGFDVKMSKLNELKAVLAASFPASSDIINQVGGVLSGFSAGTDEATIKVNVRKGVAMVAFFEIGRIPPI